MTAIDPLLDRSQNATGMWPEGRELAMLRHDIRGALMSVMGAVGQMEKATLDTEARSQIERIAAASRTLAGLVAAVMGDEPEPADPDVPEVVDIGRFLDQVRRRYVAEAAERRLGFVVDVAGSVPAALRTDALALARVLDNLIGNAMKFSDFGTVRLTASREPDGAIAFRVLDEGPGLTARGGVAPSGREGRASALRSSAR